MRASSGRREHQPQQAHRRHGGDQGRQGLLVGRLRRRDLRLRGRKFHGSMGGKPLNKLIVGMAATPQGNSYRLVASDGGIFSFGSAQFFGSTGNIALNKPIVGMAVTPSGAGYWMVASDVGSSPSATLPSTDRLAALRSTSRSSGCPRPRQAGYWLVASDGGSSRSAPPPSTGPRARRRSTSPSSAWELCPARARHRVRTPNRQPVLARFSRS